MSHGSKALLFARPLANALPTTLLVTMRLSHVIAGAAAWFAADVAATALTYKVTANEKACFYADATNKGEKIAFYFAVCAGSGLLCIPLCIALCMALCVFLCDAAGY